MRDDFTIRSLKYISMTRETLLGNDIKPLFKANRPYFPQNVDMHRRIFSFTRSQPAESYFHKILHILRITSSSSTKHVAGSSWIISVSEISSIKCLRKVRDGRKRNSGLDCGANIPQKLKQTSWKSTARNNYPSKSGCAHLPWNPADTGCKLISHVPYTDLLERRVYGKASWRVVEVCVLTCDSLRFILDVLNSINYLGAEYISQALHHRRSFRHRRRRRRPRRRRRDAPSGSFSRSTRNREQSR